MGMKMRLPLNRARAILGFNLNYSSATAPVFFGVRYIPPLFGDPWPTENVYLQVRVVRGPAQAGLSTKYTKYTKLR